MRIAVLSRNFSNAGGGAERYSVAVVAQLVANVAPQHEVHVFAQRTDRPVPGAIYHAIPMPLQKPRWINQLWFAFATWRKTRTGFDVVHSHENTWYGQVQTVHVLPVRHTLFAGKVGVARAMRWFKVITSPRLVAYLWLEAARFKPQARKRIVATSEALRAVMATTYPRSQSALEVIAPGVDGAPGACNAALQTAAREALGLPAAGTGILFVGTDFRRKGLPTLLQALVSQRQRTPNCWLAIVGQGEHNAAFLKSVQELGLAQCVFFLGSLTSVHVAYQAADCLVHPTLEDTYAMVVLEALAYGLPVLVSGAPFCGISEELSDGDNALLLSDPLDAGALALSLDRLIGDAALRNRLSQGGQNFAAQRTWDKAAARYVQSYADVAPAFRQRWLILAHAFNMDGRAASQTITDKLPHLERAGIELVVLSGVSGRRDAHYAHHQLWPAGPAGFRFELRHVLRGYFGNGRAYRFWMVLASLPLLPFMLLEKLLRPVESSWSWWLSAYVKGRSLMRKQHFDLIYSTGGAFAAHIAGAALKRATGVPWLAEVHDPFVTPGVTPATPQQKMQAQVEGLICREADVAVWFTEAALASAKTRHPELGERGHTMLPGVDTPTIALQPYQPSERFVIGHFGSLSPTRNLVAVMAALDQLLDQQPALRARVELQLTGGPLDALSAEALSHMRHPCVQHLGRIEADPNKKLSGRDQILQRMRQADVLLLMHGVEPICAEYIPSKLYEYLWMQRPILALTYRNPQLESLVRDAGHVAIALDTMSAEQIPDQIYAALLAHVTRWVESGLPDVQTTNRLTTANSVNQLLQFVAHSVAKRV